MPVFDLHSHSHHSDGALAPEALVALAHQAGVQVLALTDHDCIDGIAAARQAAQALGMTLIPGVEISANWKIQEIHIVGLQVDITNPSLVQGLFVHQQLRQQRARRMGESLAAAGIEGVYEEAVALAGGESLGRGHFAQVLVKRGLAKDISSVFRHYLTRGKPGHIPAGWASVEVVVRWIKNAGGNAVLAHPARYKLTTAQLQLLLHDFKLAGGDAIEVVTASHSRDESVRMAQLAKRFDFYASVGSDFHGVETSYSRLGQLMELPSQCKPIWQMWSERA